MTEEDTFLERVRQDAAQLRYTPRDEATWTRLAARVRERINRPANVAQMLARWLRPIAASLAMLAIVAGGTVTWLERDQSTYAVDTIASHPVEITVGGDTYNFTE